MEKFNLIIPNPEKHQYVVGIDIGHGETSAAICKLEWNKNAGQTEQNVSDIRINPFKTGSETVMISAISQVGNDDPKIGEEAFAGQQLEDGAFIKVCFKQPPVSIKGKDEKLMILFMRAIYKRIRDVESVLKDDNHVVYIARPSGWQNEETKELYRQMALKAGVPLAGLTSESRAAIFYAINHPRVGFAKEVEKGAVVFDLGSSTLDFTYLSKDTEPVDNGYPHGASIIEKTIYKDCIETNEGVRHLLINHSQYKDALLFTARRAKEEAYKKSPELEIDCSFALRSVIGKDCSDYSKLKSELVEICYPNITMLNNSIEKSSHYITHIEEDLKDFRSNWLKGKPINGVFLTGGASRMRFIKDVIKKTYGLSDSQVKIDPDNPSLTISRGIAMLGRADCVSEVLQKELYRKAKGIDINGFYSRFVREIATQIGDDVWAIIEKELYDFKNASIDRNVNYLESHIHTSLSGYSVRYVFINSLQTSIENETEIIRHELNKIINIYAPGQELKKLPVNNLSLDSETILSSLQKQADDIVGQITEQVTNNIGKIISDVLWTVLGLFLFGLFYVGYKAVQFGLNRFTKTEAERKAQEEKEKEERKIKTKARSLSKSKREEVYNMIMERKENIRQKLISEIHDSLKYNQQLQAVIEPQLKAYSEKFVKDNINSVKIPIE